MNNRQGRFLAVFFAACFLALQFHAIADSQLEQSDNQNFQIKSVSESLIDNSFDNSAIYTQTSKTPSVYLSQSPLKPEQRRQAFENNGQQSHYSFQYFMRQNLAVICIDYQHKSAIAFRHQQLLDLSFEPKPLLSSIHSKQPPEEPKQLIS